jgi:hypothetical protein
VTANKLLGKELVIWLGDIDLATNRVPVRISKAGSRGRLRVYTIDPAYVPLRDLAALKCMGSLVLKEVV